MANCRHCNDLDVYNLKLGFENLRKGVQNGCSACSMLLQGITHFVSPDDISELRIFVDYASMLRLLSAKKKGDVFLSFPQAKV